MKESGNFVLPVFDDNEFIGVVTQQAITDYLLEYREELNRAISERTADLAKANKQLKWEIEKRKRTGEALRKAHDQLEQRVEERTAELVIATDKLRADITERKRAEEMLQVSEKQYRDLYDNAPCAYFSVSAADGTIIMCNDTAQRMLGYEKEVLMQMKVFDLYSDSPSGKVKALETFKSFKAGGSVQGAELEMKHKDGSSIRIALFVTPILDNEGNVIESRSTVIDISDRRRLESQLRQSQKMEAIGVLAGGVSHDLNTLLGIMLGYGDMIRDDIGEGSLVRDNLEELMDAGYQAKKLIKQLIDFARPSEVKREPLGLSVIIEESIKLLRSSQPKTIKTHQSIEVKSDIVMGNASQIKQVIMNLGINAGRAIGDNMGELGVSLTSVEVNAELASLKEVDPGSYFRLTVSDTGCGMDPELMEHIFEPFYTTKKVGEGSGLGLSVVHGIVKSHGGFVNVESELGKGSRFHVYLPKIED